MSDRTGDGLKEVSGTGGSNDGPNVEPDGVHTMHRLLKKKSVGCPQCGALCILYRSTLNILRIRRQKTKVTKTRPGDNDLVNDAETNTAV